MTDPRAAREATGAGADAGATVGLAITPGAANLLARDLGEVVENARPAFEALRGGRIFVTGGTGFVGTWLLESFAWANRELALDASLVALTRDPQRFAEKAPHLASDPSISLLRGDVVDFEVPSGLFTHVIHAAAESSTQQNVDDPLRMIDTVVGGTRRVFEVAEGWGVRSALFVSSGAVYGSQPPDLALIGEEFLGGPDQLAEGSAYAEAKRAAELLCATFARRGVPVSIARCFAFVGPYLPIDAHFAIGNFIRDALSGVPVNVAGDGTPVRSYLYASDLAAWLWTMLVSGKPGRAYNVGSEDARSIAEVAGVVGSALEPPLPVCVAGKASVGGARNRYVPSTARARGELGVAETVELAEAVHRMLAWHANRSEESPG